MDPAGFGVDPALDAARAFAREVLAPAAHPERLALSVSARHLPGEPVGPGAAVAGPFEPFRVGDRWGGMWSTTWFRCQGRVPTAWEGREVVALVHLGGARTVGFSAEGLVWSPSLEPVQGLHHEHRELRLFAPARAGATVDFYIEAAANPIPRWHVADWPRLEPDYAGPALYALEQAELAVADRRVEALAADMWTVIELAESLPGRRAEALAALAAATAAATGGGDSSIAAARAELATVLGVAGGPIGPGRHRFAYALLPHQGGPCGRGRVVEEAESFNLPLSLRRGSSGGGQIVGVDRPGVSVEAVKWADDGDGVVVRICEVHGSRGPVGIRPSWPFAVVRRTDLLERPLPAAAPVPVGPARPAMVDLRPFELVTLRFE